MISSMFERQGLLTALCMGLAALLVLATIANVFDERLLRGVPIWLKPIKFLISTLLFALTTVWLIHLLPEAAQTDSVTKALVWTLVATTVFEIGYISLQAALGEASHYNRSSPHSGIMFTLMGIAAVALTATQLALAWQFWRFSNQPLNAAASAIVIGLVLTFVLGTASGMMLGGKQPPAGMGIPFFGWHLDWNFGGARATGDARPLHFVGLHAQQFFPILALVLPSSTALFAWVGLGAATVGYIFLWTMLL